MAVLPAGDQRVPGAPLEFSQVFREHAPYLWRALRGLGVRSADVDDAWQEVLLVVHRRLPEFDGRALRAWLYAICIRVASDYRRSARVRREVTVAAIPDSPLSDSVLETIESKELWERLMKALDELDADKRAAFVLYEIEELSLREVAEATGVPLQTIYSRLNAARAHVKSFFTSQARGSAGKSGGST